MTGTSESLFPPGKISASTPSHWDRSEEIKEEKRMLDGLYSGGRSEGREFLKTYTPFIHAVVHKVRTKDPSWSFEDLVHEAFVHLFEQECRRLKMFKFQSLLSTYIFTLVLRHLIAKVGTRDRDFQGIDDWDDIGAGMAPEWDWSFLHEPGPEERYAMALAAENKGRILAVVVSRLNPEERLLWTCLCEDRDVEETIRIMQYRDRNQRDKAKHFLMKKMQKEFLRLAGESNHG